MSRPARIFFPGAWYHIVHRAASPVLFHDDPNRDMFLALLQELHEMFMVQLHAYCLLSDHYHLLVRTPIANLDLAMRHLNSVYARRYRRQSASSGSVFRGRYKAIVIDATHYLAQVSRYIHRYPCDHQYTHRLADYHWSSYPAYIGLCRPPTWLQQEVVLASISQDSADMPDAMQAVEPTWQVKRLYQAYVEQGLEPETMHFYNKSRRQVYGDARFRRSIQVLAAAASTTKPNK